MCDYTSDCHPRNRILGEWICDIGECSDTRLNQIKHSPQADLLSATLLSTSCYSVDTVFFDNFSLDSEVIRAQR